MSRPTDDLKSVYLVISEQEMLLEHTVAKLRSRIAEVADLDFNSDTFDGDNADADAIIAAANTLPFASEKRVVFVRGVDRMNREGLERLVAYCEDPSPTTVMALTAAKVLKTSRLYKAVDRLGGIIERKAPRANELPGVITSLFADRGRKAAPDASVLLANAVGKDLRRITAEVDKVVTYLGERVDVTRADIEAVVSVTAKASVFEFVDALGDRDCGRALQLAADILAEDASPLAAHAMAVRGVRDLMVARSLIDRGQGGLAEIARAVGRADWQVKGLPKRARNFTPEELVDALRAAADSEQEMKTSREARLAFERWIVKVCGT
jgi:DNA polymerase-3 subunit delta